MLLLKSVSEGLKVVLLKQTFETASFYNPHFFNTNDSDAEPMAFHAAVPDALK